VRGTGARDILTEASGALAVERPGLFVLHWPDADRAGHEHGWMTPAYATAAHELDAMLGDLVEMLALEDSQTLLIALADHGGGGVVATDHESDHPADRTIPIILAGYGVEPGEIRLPATLVDVPATVLAAFGFRASNVRGPFVADSWTGGGCRRGVMAGALAEW